MRVSLVLLSLVILTQSLKAQVLDATMHHLRHGIEREWEDSPAEAEGQRFGVTFRTATNPGEETLRIRHRDLRLAWEVRLNGKRLATLPQDENAMVSLLAVPARALREGQNELQVLCATASPDADDVMIGGIELVHRPPAQLAAEAGLDVSVTDEASHQPLPCRLTIVDANGDLSPLGMESSQTLAVRTGVVYSSAGRAALRLPAGKYTIYAGRGFEWSVASTQVDLHAGLNEPRQMSIRREVDTTGYVAADTHIHTFTYSHHGDATLAERMITLAGEGIELPIATDHNLTIDYDKAARDAGVRRYFTPVIGNEVTTAKLGHFNVFPIDKSARPIDFRAPSWEKLFASIDSAAPDAVVILNHARDDHGGFRPFDPRRHLWVTGEDLDGQVLKANAMEVLNSGATLNDPLLLYRDWMGCLNRGLRLTPIGASDSHDVTRFIVGQGRTYIRAGDTDPEKIDIKAAVDSIKHGRVRVSYGLLADLRVDGQFGVGDLVPKRGEYTVEVTVCGPSWTRATHVALYANGIKLREAAIDADHAGRAGVKASVRWQLPRPAHDVFLTALATGPGMTAPYWPGARPYQRTSPHWEPYVFACTAAVFLDADGSGTFESAFDYATQLVNKAGDDVPTVMRALGDCDAAVAAQAASILRTRGRFDSPKSVDRAAQTATPSTRAGFTAFADGWRAFERAGAAKPATK